MAPVPNQDTTVLELIPAEAVPDKTQARGHVTIVKADGTAALAGTVDTVIADLAAGATLADTITKVNAILAALRAAGITRAA